MNLVAKFSYASALAAFAVIVFSPAVVKAADFAGTWAFAGTLGTPVVESMSGVCSLQQDENAIVGSCKGPDGVSSADGEIDGHKIILHVHHIATHAGGVKGVATFKGVLDSDGIIRGSWIDSPWPGALGDFTGQRVK